MNSIVLIYALIVTLDNGTIDFSSSEYKMDKTVYTSVARCEKVGKQKQKQESQNLANRPGGKTDNITAFFACIPVA